MNITRREWLLSLSTFSAAAALGAGGADAQVTPFEPDKDDVSALFPSIRGTYLNSASHHPMSLPAANAVRQYATDLTSGHASVDSGAVRAKFARLINAHENEIVYAPSTSMGENLVTMAMDLPARGGRIITDALHFIGSFYLYEQLGEQGMDVVILPMQKDGSVSVEQYAAAMTDDTRLIAVSHVSWINGFQHDLKALSDLAHSGDALLYVDIIQSAGNTPIDVKAMGVDFAASGTYKWLMGDFGLAYLYVRSGLEERLVRPWYGYLQTSNFVLPITHMYPLDPPGEPAYVSQQREGIPGLFNGSFPPRMIEAAMDVSLSWLLEAEPGRIQAYRQPMIQTIQQTLRERGYQPLTPIDSTSPIVSFVYENAGSLNERLEPAEVAISAYGNRFRISPSFFNDMNDVDRFLEAVGHP